MIYWSTNPQAPPTFCFFHSAPLQSVKIITLDNYYDINANKNSSHNWIQMRQLLQLTQLNERHTTQANMTERTHVSRRSFSNKQLNWKVRQFCRHDPQGGFAHYNLYSGFNCFRERMEQLVLYGGPNSFNNPMWQRWKASRKTTGEGRWPGSPTDLISLPEDQRKDAGARVILWSSNNLHGESPKDLSINNS